MPNGHIAHAQEGGYHVLRYFGRVDYMLAPSIQRFTDGLIGHEQISALIFDLTEAEYLDSTNLGLLARLAERIRDSAGARSVIVSENDDINCVLRSMGFEQIVDILTSKAAGTPKAPAEDINVEPPSEAELRSTMLDAHRRLVDLSEAGRLQFQDVVKCLESEAPPH